MRSQFLIQGPPTDLLEALKTFEKTPDPLLREIGSRLADQSDISPADFASLMGDEKLSLLEMTRGVAAASSLLSHCAETGEAPDFVAQDLAEAGHVSNPEGLVSKLEIIESTMQPRLLAHQRQLTAIRKTFPTLAFMSTKSAAAFVVEPEFKLKNDSPETYVPRSTRAVPVTVLQLDIDVFGDVRTFSVGLGREELELFIKHLQLARAELDSLISSRNLKD